ncbi:MAG: porin [Ramlibacter sp.]|nr:porin [Ramlibacter sp.]
MKRALLPLALVAACGAASAQSSVTIFGVVDAVVQVGRGSVSNLTQMRDSGYNSSRLGFRGTEDLGGGMSASFWLEAGLANDNGGGQPTSTNNQASGTPAVGSASALLFNRRSTVSLSGSWGEVRLGRDYTPQFWSLTVYDPFGNSTAAGASRTNNSAFTGVTAVRASNSMGYLLPQNLGGFFGQAQYYLGENPSNAGATKDDGSGYGLRAGYGNSVFDVAIALSRTKYAAGDIRQNNIGAQWNFRLGRVMAQYTRDSNGALDGRGFLVGGLLPVGVGELRASYSGYRTTAAGSPESKKWALGYVHNLSKRTALYATYARLSNSGGSRVALNGATTGANDPSTGYDLGIRHAF